jgi:hypothetical protein
MEELILHDLAVLKMHIPFLTATYAWKYRLGSVVEQQNMCLLGT